MAGSGTPRKGSDAVLGRDLLLAPTFQATTWGTVDLVTDPREPLFATDRTDLAVAVGGDCLRQALLLRLLTPVGSLADLGHASYGSRLHELVGQPNDASNRNRARGFVLQALADERRVARVLSLEVPAPMEGEADRIRIEVQVAPQEGGDPITLGLEVGT